MDFSEKKLYDESETYSEYSDDSQDDPSFDVLEETRLTFSNLSVKKKTKTRVKGTKEEEENERSDVIEMVIPELDDDDRKNYETIQKIIEGGQVEKLKVDQCKIYLRKHGLRLSGNKETLILRIKEHIEIVNGGGEKKYLPSSFVLNCKGDACMGDVVMFEQNVYEVFNIASRSANGPPCGTRVVAGRIVKESYGAAKQQHTFTIEVLWSKGEKPLAPLHPLLIKGRNLYRLKTMRQKWEDEGERRKMLSEKHARGGAARLNREARIQQKEMRKTQKSTRATRAEDSHGNQKVAKIEHLHSVPTNPNKPTNQPKHHTLNNTTKPQILNANPNIITHTHILPATLHQRQPLNGINCSFGGGQPTILQPVNSSAGLTWSYSHDGRNYTNYSTARIPVVRLHPHPSYFHPNVNHVNRPTQGLMFKENRGCGPMGGPIRGVGHEQKQACRYYYAQGRCRFGDRCRYLHELASNK